MNVAPLHRASKYTWAGFNPGTSGRPPPPVMVV